MQEKQKEVETMRSAREAGTATPRMDGTEVLMPQESRAEMDRLVALTNGRDTVSQQAVKIFLQGMEFQRSLYAAKATGLGHGNGR